MTGRTTMGPAHLHTRPVPMPRAPGLHSPDRKAAHLAAIEYGTNFGTSKRRGRGAELNRSAADYARIQRAATVQRAASDMPISNSTSTGTYAGAELHTYARPGAADALALPSRMNNRLHYRDGRVTDMQGNPITGVERT